MNIRLWRRGSTADGGGRRGGGRGRCDVDAALDCATENFFVGGVEFDEELGEDFFVGTENNFLLRRLGRFLFSLLLLLLRRLLLPSFLFLFLFLFLSTRSFFFPRFLRLLWGRQWIV